MAPFLDLQAQGEAATLDEILTASGGATGERHPGRGALGASPTPSRSARTGCRRRRSWIVWNCWRRRERGRKDGGSFQF